MVHDPDGHSGDVAETPTPLRVLVLCTGNSARSQLAEALLQTRGGARVVAASAGSHPAAAVNPLALQVLEEHGIPWRGREPQGLVAVEREPWDLVITVCDNARDACPVFPAAEASVHWGLEDPAAVQGADDYRLGAFRSTYEQIARRVDALLALPLETLTSEQLAERAEAIHRG